MPIAPYLHQEGPEWFIVKTQNDAFSGKRLGVTFVEGEGWTDDRLKACEFAESFNYTVILGVGAEPLAIVASPEAQVVRRRPIKNESAIPKARADARGRKPMVDAEILNETEAAHGLVEATA